jgi:(p)ppGpp synthase/HD superfamily hydrolase
MAYGARFDTAVAFAVEGFRHINRKGTSIPYISHLFAVTALVAEGGGDEDQLCAAVLHDAVEDIPGCTPALLSEAYGERVARLVVALSDSVDEHPKPPWKQRKDRYIAHLRHQPAEVKLVSVADKLHNATTLRRDIERDGVATLARFTGGVDGSMWYYREVAAALANDWSHWLVEELVIEVRRMESLIR